MPLPRIAGIRFRPPVAIARLGNSKSPLEAYTWGEDPRAFGSGQTVIIPRLSFEVLADGSVEPYVPTSIRFTDSGAIRPVCPFLELEAAIEHGDQRTWVPLTHTLLREAQMSLAELTFSVVAANRKAERRTGDPACRIQAQLHTLATRHSPQQLIAWSQIAGGPPLVLQQNPISLGYFQVIRPESRGSSIRGVNLDTIRIRFTPATGEVYGPPEAIKSQTSDSRAAHMIVPPENRILNPAAAWITYSSSAARYPPPLPSSTYDGESDLFRQCSWGVVDDTCDVVISASLAVEPTTLTAIARVIAGPPDFAPDRRPFYSIADDLADRDPNSLRRKGLQGVTPQERHDAIADLFRRAFEVSSIINLERIRYRQIRVNSQKSLKNADGFPSLGADSMTPKDEIDKRKLLSLSGQAAVGLGDAGAGANDSPAKPWSELARTRHEQLSQPEEWMRFLQADPPRVRDVLRPPFGRFSELSAGTPELTPFDFRDPRFRRSYGFDARMPPYMRDCDMAPVSLTRLQWELIFPKVEDGEPNPYGELHADARARRLKPRKV
jgi:hypothetical protein